MSLKPLSLEEYEALRKSRVSFQTLNYDAVIVKFKKNDAGLDLPIVEEAYRVADLVSVLKKIK